MSRIFWLLMVLTVLIGSQVGATEGPEAASASAGQFPVIAGSTSDEQYIQHFFPNEPNYFIGGWITPHVKFQFSFRYTFLNTAGSIVTKHPWVKGFNFGYSQTSFMDISNFEDSFFYDTSYRPEAFYYFENLPFIKVPANWQAGLQMGVGHESNGFHYPNHKSINIFYLRPIFTIAGKSHNLFLTFAPKAYLYWGPLGLNPDIADYRGYVDLRMVMGWRDGLQLAAFGRVGSHFDKGSIQLDLTYPLNQLSSGNIDILLTTQYFVGYGESMLCQKNFSNSIRFGVTLVR